MPAGTIYLSLMGNKITTVSPPKITRKKNTKIVGYAS
jgi:hypothetical protein